MVARPTIRTPSPFRHRAPGLRDPWLVSHVWAFHSSFALTGGCPRDTQAHHSHVPQARSQRVTVSPGTALSRWVPSAAARARMTSEKRPAFSVRLEVRGVGVRRKA